MSHLLAGEAGRYFHPLSTEGTTGVNVLKPHLKTTVLTLLALPAMYAAWFKVRRDTPGVTPASV